MSSFTYQRLASRTEARSAFDTALEGSRHRLSLFDSNGEHYGLDRLQVCELAQHFMQSNPLAEIEVIVQDIDFIEKSCPRFVSLVRRYSPRIRVLKTEASLSNYQRGIALFDEATVLRRPHFDQSLTIWDSSESSIAQARELLEQIRQKSSVALLPPTGL